MTSLLDDAKRDDATLVPLGRVVDEPAEGGPFFQPHLIIDVDNSPAVASAVDMPFGGFKQSGIGRGHGLEGISEYTELQIVPT